jgi:alpha-beta hydrolase superfamily lysophospholipase
MPRSVWPWHDRGVARLRSETAALPTEIGVHDGLAYSLWLPAQPARGGVVILHGAGSVKESHHDFARVIRGAGLAAIAFDQRGHGESEGRMGDRVLDDVAAIGALLRARIGEPAVPLALRGSSMGGYLAILAAPTVDAGAVVAICPAGGQGLARGLEAGRFSFQADVPALAAFFETHDVSDAVAELDVPLLLLHAEGDEQVPVAHSRELAARATHETSRLITVPGGHHRSIQHDHELQAVSLRFIERALGLR